MSLSFPLGACATQWIVVVVCANAHQILILCQKDNATFEDIADFVRKGGVGYSLLIGTKSSAQ